MMELKKVINVKEVGKLCLLLDELWGVRKDSGDEEGVKEIEELEERWNEIFSVLDGTNEKYLDLVECEEIEENEYLYLKIGK